MAKFLGVISNSTKSSCDQQILEFTDLELLSNCVLNETENLYLEFMQKLKFINDQELIIFGNSDKLVKIYEYLQVICSRMCFIEEETNEIGSCLSQVETMIFQMQHNPPDFACKCASNKERNKILNMLIQLSEHVHRTNNQIEETKEYECQLSMKNLCSWTYRFKPFLELHNKILLQTESKLSRISDLLKEVDRMFFQLNERLMCRHFRKIQHCNVSDC